MNRRDKVRVEKQKERSGQGLNPDLPGERPMSYPIHHEDLMQNIAFLSGFKLYFCQFLLGNQSKTLDIAI